MKKIDFLKTAIGIELGSTRIKAVLIDERFGVLASGVHEWENRFENNLFTYSLDDVWSGVQSCYAGLKAQVKEKFGETLTVVGSLGISAMMHGYMVFDENKELLTPFRTWRNNNAAEAAQKLTRLFGYNIPARWSIAHLYQAILNKEEHIGAIDYQTTLSGYIHWRLTGKRVVGVGEASGMFPINIAKKQYDERMKTAFNEICAANCVKPLDKILPQVLLAGEAAGALTKEGALLLDPQGDLKAGIPICPPEGDAGTGMVATNSVKKLTGNVSAGTSIFCMVVLEKELKKVYPQIDLVTTPSGDLVGMAHCNNCTSDLNAWVDLLYEAGKLSGARGGKTELLIKLFNLSLSGDDDAGGLIECNYISGENITGIEKGRPMFLRTTQSAFNLPNFMRAQIYSCLVTLKIGLDILLKNENVKVETLWGHGGIFKTEGVFSKYLASALNVPLATTKDSGEGGAWGMAVLAMFMTDKEKTELSGYLEQKVFKAVAAKVELPDETLRLGIQKYTDNFIDALPVVKLAEKAVKGEK